MGWQGARTADFRMSLSAAALALVCLVATSTLGDVDAKTWTPRVIAWAGAGVFLLLASTAVRHAGAEVHRVLVPRIGPSHAGVLRLVINLAGLTVAALATLGLLAVPIQQLLLGGALTGVIVGIAAQQALGNVFAGLVLLLARPFNVGDAIRVRAGALGGDLQGRVLAMGLTYVTLDTPDGPLNLPNSAVLAAGVGRVPAAPGSPSRQPVRTALVRGI